MATGPPKGILMTDLEGSTVHLHALGGGYGAVLARHHDIIRQAIAVEGGVEVGREGDSFAAVFDGSAPALRAAVAAQRVLSEEVWPDGPWRVRMGVHAGEVDHSDAGPVGMALHEAARVRGVAHDLGDSWQIAMAVATHGYYLARSGRLDEAAADAVVALSSLRSLHADPNLIHALHDAAWLLFHAGEPDRAAVLLGAALPDPAALPLYWRARYAVLERLIADPSHAPAIDRGRQLVPGDAAELAMTWLEEHYDTTTIRPPTGRERVVRARDGRSGGSGIRTHGGLPHTRFPSVPIRPLSHPSRGARPVDRAVPRGATGRQCGRSGYRVGEPALACDGRVLCNDQPVNRVRAGRQQLSAGPGVCRRSPDHHMGERVLPFPHGVEERVLRSPVRSRSGSAVPSGSRIAAPPVDRHR